MPPAIVIAAFLLVWFGLKPAIRAILDAAAAAVRPGRSRPSWRWKAAAASRAISCQPCGSQEDDSA